MSEFRRYAARGPETAMAFTDKRDDLLSALGAQIIALAGHVGVRFVVPQLDVARIALAVYTEGFADSLVDEAAGRAGSNRDVLAFRIAAVVHGLIRP